MTQFYFEINTNPECKAIIQHIQTQMKYCHKDDGFCSLNQK